MRDKEIEKEGERERYREREREREREKKKRHSMEGVHFDKYPKVPMFLRIPLLFLSKLL
jgi:hypothetical protein